jgi:hypothetical protein
MSFRALTLLAVLSLAAVGCETRTIVDGLPIGQRTEGDSRFEAFALATLDDVAPGHAPVESVEMYVPDFRTPDGSAVIANRSGGHDLIVLLHLADGSVRAFYIGCGVGLDTERCFLGPPDQLR